MDCMALRGLILSKYKTITAFSEAIGWNRTKASRIVNGIQEPTIQDVKDLTRILEIESLEGFARTFFAQFL